MALFQGWKGQVKFKTFQLHALRWECNISTTLVDVTNFVYFSSAAYASSLKEGELNFDCIYDDEENPFSVGGNFVVAPGTFGSCELIIDQTGGTAAKFTFPNIIILGARHTQMIRDVSRYSLNAMVSVTQLAHVPTLAAN